MKRPLHKETPVTTPQLTSTTSRRSILMGLASLPLLAACSPANDTLGEQAGNVEGKNYIAGDGSVMEFAPEQRGEPVQFTSTLFSGEAVDSTDWQGQPVMLNFWYAACAPCRVEAPDLQALYEKFEPQNVKFFGVNVRDNAAAAAAFERNFGIEYPSMEERVGGVLLAMTEYVPPQAMPTTIVLDRQGRVAARILGIAERATLRALLDTAVAE